MDLPDPPPTPVLGPSTSSGSHLGPAATAPGRPGGSAPRRWLVWVVVVTLLATSVGLGAIALDQRSSAASWRDRAAVLDDQLDVAVAQRDEARERGTAAVEQRDDLAASAERLQAQLDQAASSLRVSERDVVDLEARLRVLADDRAQAQDGLVLGEQRVAALQAVSQRTAEAVDELETCVAGLQDLREAVSAVRADAAEPDEPETDGAPTDAAEPDADALDQRVVQAASACEQARASAAEAGAAADLVLAR